MAPLKNIVWVGTGKVGLPLLSLLLATKKFNITLLTRNAPNTYSLPSTLTNVHQVSYNDPSTIVPHLRGQDAVIVFSTFAPGGTDFDTKHIALVNAAIEAGVPYFIPSEWALDTAGIMGSTSERYGPTLPTNMVLAPKRVSHNYLLCRAAEKKIKFAAVYPGVLFEACFRNGLFQLDFDGKKALLPDGGINPFPTSSFATLAKVITTLFEEPEKISNRFYHISDGVLTQKEIVYIIEKETATKWETGSFSIAGVREAAAKSIEEGVYGLKEYRNSLITPFFGGLQVWTRVDNEVLRVNGVVDVREEIVRLVRERY